MIATFRRTRTVLVLAFVLVVSSTANGQVPFIWNLDADGTWDTTTINWLQSGSPVTYNSSPTSIATFGNIITASRVIGVQAGGINAGTINFDNLPAFYYTVGTVGNDITLDNGAGNASINVMGTLGAALATTGGHTITGSNISFLNNLNINNNGAFGSQSLTIAGGVNRTTAGGQVIHDGVGNTTISGALGANITGGLVKNGTGTLALTNAANAFAGGITINGGVVAVSADGQLGAAANGVTISPGGVLRIGTGAFTLGAARTIAVNGTPANPSVLDLTGGATTIVGIGAGQLTGSGALRTWGTNGVFSTLSIDGANPGFTGSVNIASGNATIGSLVMQRGVGGPAGTLRFTNSGTLAATTGIRFDNGGLTITQPAGAAATTNRLGAAPLTFNSGAILYTTSNNNGGPAINDTFGATTIHGLTRFTGSAVAGPAAGTSLNFGNLTRVDNAVLFFRSTASGVQGTFGGTPGPTSNNVFFANLTPDDTSSGTTRSIIPWAAASTSLASNDPQNFMTYDSNGFRPLSLTTEVVLLAAANTLAAAPAGTNVRTTLAGANQTIATGGQTINSYSSSTTQTITGNATPGVPGDVLTNTSGGMANFNTQTITNATLNFPNGAFIHLGFPVIVGGDSSITGSGGVTVSAQASSTNYQLRFTNTQTGGNPFTGGLFINGFGQVTFTADNQLGAAGEDITLNGGQLLTAVNATLGAGREIRFGDSGGVIGQSGAGNVLEIPGLISGGSGQVTFGGGASSSATGVVSLSNPSANTYAGRTVLSTGILRLTNSNQLGTSSEIVSFGGNLQAGADLTFAVAPRVATTMTIDTQAFNITLNNGVSGSGGVAGATLGAMTKTGTGILTLNGAGDYKGTIAVNGGTLNVNGTLASGGGLVTVANTGTLGGTGTINRNVTVASGGMIKPGTSPGMLTVGGAVTMSVGARHGFDYAAPVISAAFNSGGSATAGSPTGNNLLTVNGSLDVQSGAVLRISGNFSDFTPNQDYSFQIAAATTVVTAFNFDSVSNPTAFDTSAFIGFDSSSFLQWRSVGGNVYFNMTPVPEPVNILLMCGGAAVGVRWFRKRRQAKKG